MVGDLIQLVIDHKREVDRYGSYLPHPVFIQYLPFTGSLVLVAEEPAKSVLLDAGLYHRGMEWHELRPGLFAQMLKVSLAGLCDTARELCYERYPDWCPRCNTRAYVSPIPGAFECLRGCHFYV